MKKSRRKADTVILNTLMSQAKQKPHPANSTHKSDSINSQSISEMSSQMSTKNKDTKPVKPNNVIMRTDTIDNHSRIHSNNESNQYSNKLSEKPTEKEHNSNQSIVFANNINAQTVSLSTIPRISNKPTFNNAKLGMLMVIAYQNAHKNKMRYYFHRFRFGHLIMNDQNIVISKSEVTVKEDQLQNSNRSLKSSSSNIIKLINNRIRRFLSNKFNKWYYYVKFSHLNPDMFMSLDNINMQIPEIDQLMYASRTQNEPKSSSLGNELSNYSRMHNKIEAIIHRIKADAFHALQANNNYYNYECKQRAKYILSLITRSIMNNEANIRSLYFYRWLTNAHSIKKLNMAVFYEQLLLLIIITKNKRRKLLKTAIAKWIPHSM